jgi:hypothetical protein
VLALITDRTRLHHPQLPGQPDRRGHRPGPRSTSWSRVSSAPAGRGDVRRDLRADVYDGREHVSLLAIPEIADRLILLDGWSKTYAMTGWRIGYGVWPPALVEGATRLAVNCHSCVNAAAQFAGIAALEGPQDAVDEMVKAFDERRT